jgi:CheY-like chemotaxis protein
MNNLDSSENDTEQDEVCPSKVFILHVDDNAEDRYFFESAARRVSRTLLLKSFASIPESIDFLNKAAARDQASYAMPTVVMLDYCLGQQRGSELLRWLRGNERFTFLPVIMLSDAEGEPIKESYRAGANIFIAKPTSLRRLEEILQVLVGCLSWKPPRFDRLKNLPEYRPAAPAENASNLNEERPIGVDKGAGIESVGKEAETETEQILRREMVESLRISGVSFDYAEKLTFEELTRIFHSVTAQTQRMLDGLAGGSAASPLLHQKVGREPSETGGDGN